MGCGWVADGWMDKQMNKQVKEQTHKLFSFEDPITISSKAGHISTGSESPPPPDGVCPSPCQTVRHCFLIREPGPPKLGGEWEQVGATFYSDQILSTCDHNHNSKSMHDAQDLESSFLATDSGPPPSPATHTHTEHTASSHILSLQGTKPQFSTA